MPLSCQGMLSAPNRPMPAKRTRILIGLALLCYAAVYELNQAQPCFYSRLCYLYRDALARSGRYTRAPGRRSVFVAARRDDLQHATTPVRGCVCEGREYQRVRMVRTR